MQNVPFDRHHPSLFHGLVCLNLFMWSSTCRNNREKIHHDTFLDAPGFPWSHSHGFILRFRFFFFFFSVISPQEYPLIADLQHHFRPQVTELSRNERADSCPTFLTYFFSCLLSVHCDGQLNSGL